MFSSWQLQTAEHPQIVWVLDLDSNQKTIGNKLPDLNRRISWLKYFVPSIIYEVCLATIQLRLLNGIFCQFSCRLISFLIQNPV
jgi:hypothetical protein